MTATETTRGAEFISISDVTLPPELPSGARFWEFRVANKSKYFGGDRSPRLNQTMLDVLQILVRGALNNIDLTAVALQPFIENGVEDGETVLCSNYDFETGQWSAWGPER